MSEQIAFQKLVEQPASRNFEQGVLSFLFINKSEKLK